MARRFFAITLFALALAAAPAAKANDFTDHFTFAKPPVAVPPFTFQDAKGQVLDLKNFRGHYVLLNLWATWCGPCVKEMPALDALAQKLSADAKAPNPNVTDIAVTTAVHSKMDIVALTEDRDGLGAAQGFYKRHNLRHLTVFVDDGGEAPSILKVNGLPTTLLIDPRGMEIGRIEGATDWDDPETITFLEAQMKPAIR